MSTLRKPLTKSTKPRAPECVTVDLGLEGFSECPQIGPSTCDFAVPFGYAFLCRHPGTGERDQNAGTEGSTTQPAENQSKST